MQAAVTNSVILHELSHLPQGKRQEVLDFILFLRSRTVPAKPRAVRKSLTGIWQNKGFEKIDDIEQAMQEARSEMYASILKKEL